MVRRGGGSQSHLLVVYQAAISLYSEDRYMIAMRALHIDMLSTRKDDTWKAITFTGQKSERVSIA